MIYKYNFAFRVLEQWEGSTCVSKTPIDVVYNMFFKGQNISDFEVVRRMAQKNNQKTIEMKHYNDWTHREYVSSIMDAYTGEEKPTGEDGF